MIEQLTDGLGEVWTGSAVLAAIVGGLVMGWVVENTAPQTRPWQAVIGYAAGIGLLAVAVFWSGQVVDTALSGDEHWGRAIARAALQAAFMLTAAVSAGWLRWRSTR